MLAGCPAVVGTLWDVTDKDIDRFASSMLEEWGLLPRGTFSGRGQDEGQVEDAREGGGSSSQADDGAKACRIDSNSNSSSKYEGEQPHRSRSSSRSSYGQASLAEAVTRARDAPRFRYLTAAAVCVYGIPV